MAVLPDQQTVPVHRAQQRPYGDRAEIYAHLFCLTGILPDRFDPLDLFSRRGVEMNLRDGDGKAVSSPGPPAQPVQSSGPDLVYGLRIDVLVPAVTAPSCRRGLSDFSIQGMGL